MCLGWGPQVGADAGMYRIHTEDSRQPCVGASMYGIHTEDSRKLCGGSGAGMYAIHTEDSRQSCVGAGLYGIHTEDSRQPCVAFCMGSGGLNSGPPAYEASTLQMKSSPWALHV